MKQNPGAMARLVTILAAISMSVCTGIDLSAATTRPVAQLVSQDDAARLRRGEQVRKVLLETLEQSYRDNGAWPEHLVGVTDGSSHLVYTQPSREQSARTRDSLRKQMRSAAATVVLFEPIEQNPSGVWVGYEDGHLEFVRTSDDLAACESQKKWIIDPVKTAATQPSPTGDSPLTLKLLDPGGSPVGGALVGIWGNFASDRKGPPIQFLHGDSSAPAISNERGEVSLTTSMVFQAKFSNQPSTPLFILDEPRQLVGRVELKRDDFGNDKMRQIRLCPICRVRGRLTSLALSGVGKHLDWTNTILFTPGQVSMYTTENPSTTGDFNFPLPPGVYGIECYGEGCNPVYRYFQVEPGRRELNLQLDLPASTIARLVGRPAPELTQIKGWENGGPISLSELHGKVVLLDFWGYWCGPCIRSMPALMKLHEEFKEKTAMNESVSPIGRGDCSLPSRDGKKGKIAIRGEASRLQEPPLSLQRVTSRHTGTSGE